MKFNRAEIGKIFQTLFFAAILCALATGCATYQQQNRVIQYWQQGDTPAAAAEATRKADENADNKDTVIWRLEQGTTLRANGKFKESNQAFDAAQEKIDQYAEAAKVHVALETGALLSNQAELPYEGRAYDGIMLNTYKALNDLSLGEPDKARVELIRAYQRQQDAVEDNKRRIEKVQQQAEQNQDKAAIDRAQQDPNFQRQISGAFANLDEAKSYANYVNPFTVYLDGLFFMVNAADASDLERAHKSFERVAGFTGDNDYIKQDLAAVDGLMNGKPLTPVTYVIFETGCAPVRDQIRIDIPIILSRVSYVGAAFPILKIQGNHVPRLIVSADGRNAETTLLSSMDGVIAQDFKNELPVVITKTVASAVVKGVAAYAINDAAASSNNNNQNPLGGLIAQIGTAVYQVAVNIADTRTWTTLPKEFQFCRIPTPPDGKIELETPSGGQRIPVTINGGTVNLVYVKSINAATPLLVTQMKLK